MNCKIVVSLTHLKNIIAIAEQNAVDDPGMSPYVEIELTEKSYANTFYGRTDKVKIMQLPYSFNAEPKLIGR